MKQTIRALGVATTILWIAFLFFIVTAGYSALNFKVELGQARVSVSDGVLRMSIPFKISNAGYYDVTELNITTRVLEENGAIISESATFIPEVPRGSNMTETHDVSVNLKELVLDFPSYLFEDSHLTLEQIVGLRFAKVFPLQVSANATMQWGAPLRNLSAEQVFRGPHNSTHSKAGFEIRFENGSPFDVSGVMEAEVYNEEGKLLGSVTSRLEVAPNSVFSQEVMVTAKTDELTASGEVHLYFDTYMFRFGPLVIHYEGG